MLIKSLVVGHFGVNTYIVTDADTMQSVVIDPGDESNTILDYTESNKMTIKHIFITHGHFDHVGAVEALAEETGADIWINEKDVAKEGDDLSFAYSTSKELKFYSDGDTIQMGNLTFEILETPGHSRGSVTIKCEDVLFTGDTLFHDSCGRTDLPGGDMQVLIQSLKRLAALEGEYEIYPGHMGQSSLSWEKEFNYYVRYAMSER